MSFLVINIPSYVNSVTKVKRQKILRVEFGVNRLLKSVH